MALILPWLKDLINFVFYFLWCSLPCSLCFLLALSELSSPALFLLYLCSFLAPSLFVLFISPLSLLFLYFIFTNILLKRAWPWRMSDLLLMMLVLVIDCLHCPPSTYLRNKLIWNLLLISDNFPCLILAIHHEDISIGYMQNFYPWSSGTKKWLLW